MYNPTETSDEVMVRFQKTHDEFMAADPSSRASLQKAMQTLVELYGIVKASEVCCQPPRINNSPMN